MILIYEKYHRGQSYYKNLFTKIKFRGNSFCNYFTKTLCIQLEKARKGPQKYYKNNSFRELFCNNFGRDGIEKLRISRVIDSFSQQTGVYPYPLSAGSARPNPKMGAPVTEHPS